MLQSVDRHSRAHAWMILALAIAVAAVVGYGLGGRDRPEPVVAAQPASSWNSAMLWFPSLVETGDAVAELVNQIDASCSVDVDPVLPTNGEGPEGAVYAFAVTWACPVTGALTSSATWNSSTLWYPTLAETGDALAALTNQIDASCALDVDRLVAANGAGPEGPVYAFTVTWACPGASQAAAAPLAPGSVGTVSLEVANFAFAPAQLTIPANTATPIKVRNTSDLPHTFMIEKPGVAVEAPPGETRPVTVTAPPGTYTSVCTYHPDRTTGTLIAE